MKSLYSTVLVTGCGGDIAQGIARILKQTGLVDLVLGADMVSDHEGLLDFDTCLLLPPAREDSYLHSLEKTIRMNQVDLLIPMSEAEIQILLDQGSSSKFAGIPVVMANPVSVRTGLDKLATVEFLASCGLAHPWTMEVGHGPPKELPCILKPRRGQGGKGFVLIQNRQQSDLWSSSRTTDIWQEWLQPDEEEYTCGLYRTGKGEVRSIIFRRKLNGDVTGSGISVHDEEIQRYLECIANNLELKGSINVQLRKTGQGPVAFEINPRFSSTLVFRHLFGFQDLVWSIQETAGLEAESFSGYEAGIRFFRRTREVILNPDKGGKP